MSVFAFLVSARAMGVPARGPYSLPIAMTPPRSLLVPGLALLAPTLAVLHAAASPLPYPRAGAALLQDFDSLPISKKAPAPWLDAETLPGWHVWFASNRDGAGSGPGSPLFIHVSDGAATGTRLYSLGAAGSGERALGANAGATSGHAVIAIALRNDTADTLRKISVSYVLEQWRAGASAPRSFNADYFLGPLPGPGLLSGEWTPVEALSFTTPVASASPVALDGNAAAHRAPLRAEITDLAWRPRQLLWLRFVNRNESGGGHLFALDDFEFSAR